MIRPLIHTIQRVTLTLGLALGLTLTLLWAMRGELTPPVFAANFAVTTTSDTFDGTCDTDCSLRDAIYAANSTAGDDTIIVPAGTYTLSISGRDEEYGVTGDLDIYNSPISGTLTIMGNSSADTIINANHAPKWRN